MYNPRSTQVLRISDARRFSKNIFFLRQLQAKFDSIKYLTLLEVSNMTGCYPPCLFDEYRYQSVSKVEVSKIAARQNLSASLRKSRRCLSSLCGTRPPIYLWRRRSWSTHWNLWWQSLVRTHFTVDKKVFKLCITGGTLGLFLGFSFLNLWDVVEIAAGVVPAVFKLIARIFR